MRKLLFFVLAISLLATQNVFAVPAYPGIVERTLSDGTVVAVYIKGDEKVRWMESLDGYTLMNNDKLDVVFAIKNADGDLLPSKILYRGQELSKYSSTERATIESLSKKLRYSEKQISMFKQIRGITGASPSNVPPMQKAATAPVVTPVLGNQKVLCILVNFTNKTLVKSVSEFEALMNQVGYTAGGNAGSVKDFYRANSYGKMDITVTVAGPVTLSNTTAYYGSDPTGERRFGRDVATAADAVVDFSQFARYMQNPNSSSTTLSYRVPSFHIIFAGYGDEAINNGQQIWSHKWNFVNDAGTSYQPLQLDGVWVGDVYSCSPELRGKSGSTITSIGVACHELCHAFGAPDYYDTDYQDSGGEYPGTGKWDLMADGSWNGASNDGTSPAQINIFQKILFGWVNPVELTTPTGVTSMPNSVDSAMAYFVKVNDANGEMYVLENRQQKGFDKYVPGYGLLIYHIHTNALGGSANNKTHPQQVYVVAAGSTTAIPTSTASSYGSINAATATFGGTKTEFTSTSTPRMFRWNGTSGIAVDLPITNISRTTSAVSFAFLGENPTYVIAVSANPTAGGKVSGGDSSALHGTSVTVKATPDTCCYSFVNWTENGKAVSTSASYAFTAAVNRTLVANFRITTGIADSPQPNPLKAWVSSSTLRVSGLTTGRQWSVYSISGALVHQGVAGGEEESITLNTPAGVYIVVQGQYSVKVAY